MVRGWLSAARRTSPQTPSVQHPDLGLLVSRTVTGRRLLRRAPALRDFVMAARAD